MEEAPPVVPAAATPTGPGPVNKTKTVKNLLDRPTDPTPTPPLPSPAVPQTSTGRQKRAGGKRKKTTSESSSAVVTGMPTLQHQA
jgi:hypothetical protein